MNSVGMPVCPTAGLDFASRAIVLEGRDCPWSAVAVGQVGHGQDVALGYQLRHPAFALILEVVSARQTTPGTAHPIAVPHLDAMLAGAEQERLAHDPLHVHGLGRPNGPPQAIALLRVLLPERNLAIRGDNAQARVRSHRVGPAGELEIVLAACRLQRHGEKLVAAIVSLDAGCCRKTAEGKAQQDAG